MCDGWFGPTRSIINFLVYCDRMTIFHNSVDASDKIHNSNDILDLMRDVVDEIGEEYIVQVVTNNGANYMKVGKILMLERQHQYWTSCAAHYIDLMMKHIRQLSKIKSIVDSGQVVLKYIYNHTWVLSLMRKLVQRELLRPG